MDKFKSYIESIGEYGVVKEVHHPIAVISGLPHAKPHEIVIFETGEMGEVFMIEKDTIDILVFSREPIKVGTQVARTDQFMSVPVGDELLGAIIDPLGEPLTATKPFKRPKEMREIDREVHKLATRSKITKPLWTGTTLVDMMIPLGKGQRELVIGDRKTGKSSFLLSTIKKQVEEGAIAIYAGIARKKNDIKILQQYFEKEGIADKVVMVATTSKDSPSLIYVTPYTAITIAEYFRDKGQDVLVVLDDLSSHAKFYREVSLLAKRFPGRESYPGDIFYVHAKLVERAGCFYLDEERTKTASITCIPVVEIVESDLAAYISTNVMGMTDGHIFFDTNAYNEGKRPAINIPLSVTRVGKQTQTKLKREITSKLSAFLATYAKLESFSHFGAELSETVKAELNKGKNVYNFFDQHYNQSVPTDVQLIMFGLIWSNSLNDLNREQLHDLRKGMISAYNTTDEVKTFFGKLIEGVEKIDDLVANVTKEKSQIIALCKTDNQSEKK
jgi:F-type H+/Na+-transporting ATPase subunit alpha